MRDRTMSAVAALAALGLAGVTHAPKNQKVHPDPKDRTEEGKARLAAAEAKRARRAARGW